MCTHCWHKGGSVYTSYPPQWDEKCCLCGMVERKWAELPDNHGLGLEWGGSNA